mmetsp:Transcript_20537/g.66503  ORF Transcript_20537/g.66503 Transcript_20537/m.66503 type:complete len:203 (+) Transcript_20537:1605-2213(+)
MHQPGVVVQPPNTADAPAPTGIALSSSEMRSTKMVPSPPGNWTDNTKSSTNIPCTWIHTPMAVPSSPISTTIPMARSNSGFGRSASSPANSPTTQKYEISPLRTSVVEAAAAGRATKGRARSSQEPNFNECGMYTPLLFFAKCWSTDQPCAKVTATQPTATQRRHFIGSEGARKASGSCKTSNWTGAFSTLPKKQQELKQPQ